MRSIAHRKLHFAPYARQLEAIERLLAEGEARNVTELLRRAIDHYLEARGRPSLMEDAALMAEDFHRDAGLRHAPSDLQAASAASDEEW